MIKIFSADQIREADKCTISKEPVSSTDLMERAASRCTEWILSNFPPGISFLIVCGNGNNGGDGLAIARQLFNAGKEVQVILPAYLQNPSPDFLINRDRINHFDPSDIITLDEQNKLPEIKPSTVVIEALYGSGLNRKIEGKTAELIRQLNDLKNPVIAIDIPAGLFGSNSTNVNNPIIKATYTLTFQYPKLSFMFPEYAVFTGDWTVLDIDLDANFARDTAATSFLLEEEDIRQLLHKRSPFSHKGMFGHALLLAGSVGKAGAAVLSAQGCLRSGAGLLTVRLAEKLVNIIQTAVPEAMVSVDEEPAFISTPLKPADYSVVGMGPGLGNDKATGNVIKRIIQDFDLPLVIDADAINIVAENPTWLNFLKPGCIFTPHIGEFRRLVGNYPDPFDRMKAQLDFVKKYNCYLLLKGKFSAFASPDGTIVFNPTGNPGMATGGSGDVLTGIITGLLSQGYSSWQSGAIGMYLHGLAGDLGAFDLSENSLLAGDLISYLPAAFKQVKSLQ